MEVSLVGKTVSVSSTFYGSESPDLIVDGNLSTWLSGSGVVNEWAQVDLGQTVLVMFAILSFFVSKAYDEYFRMSLLSGCTRGQTGNTGSGSGWPGLATRM